MPEHPQGVLVTCQACGANVHATPAGCPCGAKDFGIGKLHPEGADIQPILDELCGVRDFPLVETSKPVAK